MEVLNFGGTVSGQEYMKLQKYALDACCLPCQGSPWLLNKRKDCQSSDSMLLLAVHIIRNRMKRRTLLWKIQEIRMESERKSC